MAGDDSPLSEEVVVTMTTEKRNFETYLFSIVGVVGMLVVLIALNIVFSSCNARRDCTEEHLYTLTDGTKQILKDMDTPVTIRFYYSKDVAQIPPVLKTYAERVQDLLKEYQQYGGKNIDVVKLNPTPDSDAADSANLDGVVGQPLGAFGTGDKVYLGLAVSCLDKTVALPFLSPERENLLEYDITRAIYRVLHPEKIKVGVISSLPVMGVQMPPQMMMQMGKRGNQPPWQVITELKRDFDLVELKGDVDSIDGDINVLLLIHPKDLKDKTLYAIDQFLLRGGKILAFLDPMSMVESQNRQQPMQFQPPGASSLGNLLDAWGVKFDTEKLIADTIYMARVRRRAGAPPEPMPLVLALHGDAIDHDDPATGQLDNLLFVYGGAFTGDGAEGLTKTVLIKSSDSVEAVEKFMAQGSPQRIIRDFKSLEVPQSLAIRLTGTFKTAFPDGKPEDDDADTAAKDKKKDAKKDEKTAGLKKSSTPSAVILVGDSDMVYDHFCIQKGNFMGASFIQPINDNLAMVQNMLEQLSGDSRLISIRSRGAISRPLDAITKLQAEAEKKWQSEINSLEDELREARSKVSELQRAKGGSGDKMFISKETMAAIKKFRQKEAETNKKLKLVRKELRRDIEALQNTVTWLDILVMPMLVALGGLALAIIKRQRMVRK